MKSRRGAYTSQCLYRYSIGIYGFSELDLDRVKAETLLDMYLARSHIVMHL